MSFKYVYLLTAILLSITSCNEVKQSTAKVSLPSMPTVAIDAKQCSGNTWSETGYEPKCIACPDDAKVIKTKDACICNDKTTAFNARGNVCKKKLTEAQAKFLLL